MSADGSATVFCFTPRRLPVDELLSENAAAARSVAGNAPTTCAAALPPTEPCPVCPFLTEKLAASLALANCRQGENRELASRLCGWQIDIKEK